jgi:preprotein translocase subunit YajC
MNLNFLSPLLGQATNSPATTTTQNPTGVILNQVLLFGGIFAIFYLLMIRPQSKKAKELAAKLNSLKPGDKVITSSGIIGTVVSIKDRTLSLRSAETKLEVLKSAVSEITERGGETSSAE